MSVRSRTTIWLLPRSVTRARQALEGAWHRPFVAGMAVVVGIGFVVREAEVPFPVAEPQAAASSAVTASSRSQPAVLMVLQTQTRPWRIGYGEGAGVEAEALVGAVSMPAERTGQRESGRAWRRSGLSVMLKQDLLPAPRGGAH